jgi:PH (Pleckstrin Homology) domain-containing protein
MLMARVIAQFPAPWSRSLSVVTAGAVAVLLVVMLTGLFLGPRAPPQWRAAMVAVPLAVLLGSLPFMVRGYILTDEHIEVRRLGWSTVLPLAGLVAVSGEPEGLRGSVRLFGNGGLFGISGWFWNRRIGRFRAYATDPGRVVLLRYRDGRKVVVTPHDVQHFIVRLRTLAKTQGGD